MSSASTVRIEGGLFSPDLLHEAKTAGLPGQKPGDFGLPQGRSVTDEAAATFQDARALWGVFQNRLAKLSSDDLATTATRDGWVIPFLGLLGYELRFNQRAFELDGQTYALSHRAGESDSAPPVHIVGARQDLGRVPASGRPRMAPHSLVQEFLNRSEHVWGIATNGRTLRLLRDTTFVRRQAYVEFDLEALFEEQRFDDFLVLYRLLHRSRLPRGMDDGDGCLLEQYYARSVEQGGRVREHLREGVEECLVQLANGFLSHPENSELRRQAQAAQTDNANISGEELYRQLLRIVYRFLFLMVSEERGLVSRDRAYREHYGVSRLRRLVDQRAAYTHDDDVWQSLRVLWKVLASEELATVLRVAPLNGQLFDPVDLDGCTISNRDLLNAFWRLTWYREGNAPPRRVNYAALDVEELGSVYESLLEFHPRIEDAGGGRVTFHLLAGSERKTTGSYYTPPELVNELIQSALEPVIQARLTAAGKSDRAAALLSMRVCDPACGSGHFLLAAARRLGKALAKERTGEDEPPPERVRECTRDVIAHCIYGVDRNPLAVDLCRVALWLESHTGGRPLTFLDHRIKCGDSLVGVFDLSTLANGIPDKAFTALEGDDKEVASAAAKLNKRERETGGRSLFDADDAERPAVLSALGQVSRAVDALTEDSPEAVRRKRRQYEELQERPDWVRQKRACDLWTAAFFQSLVPGRLHITSGRLAEYLNGGSIDSRLHAEAMVRAESERFFHWPLEFPEVMADGGFDVVLSNPPWERIKLQEQEFFAARDVGIANAQTSAVRRQLISDLKVLNPTLHQDYRDAMRASGAVSQLLRNGGRFPLAGRGDINTYAVFAELCRDLPRVNGGVGVIVPSGIATDDTTKFFFQDVMSSGTLVSLYDFENRRGIFPAVHKSYKFCLLTLANRPPESKAPAEFVFFALDVGDVRKADKRFTLTAEEISLLSPNTGNCPIFRTRADAELTKAIYRRVPVLWREGAEGRPESNPWGLRFARLFDMSTDSHHFKLAANLEREGYRREGNVFVSQWDRYLPLFEAKMVHQFDHRWATYENADDVRDVTPDEKRDPNFVVQARYWVREEIVESAVPKFPEPLAGAVAADSADAVRAVLQFWLAGYYLAQSRPIEAHRHVQAAAAASRGALPKPLLRALQSEDLAETLQRDFELMAEDVTRIERALDSPMAIADELLDRFSPKWFMGWRDICRSTDERTTIAAAIPKAAVGDTFLLMLSFAPPRARLPLLACLNSLVQDYAARQKVGGTHMKYNVFRQLPIPEPKFLSKLTVASGAPLAEWLTGRVMALNYTAHDLDALAQDVNWPDRPILGPENRAALRAEIDAAMFHVYLASTPDGQWLPASRVLGHVVDESEAELSALRAYFPTPRAAVSHILRQFPIVRAKDEAACGHYRTEDETLRRYDEMRPITRTAAEPPGEPQ